jgi:ribosomal protein S18 acetylase RimI-like enzyme
MGPAQIVEARTDKDFDEARTLVEEYAAGVGVDLCFQNFTHELAHLPEVYGPPRGSLLIAHQEAALIGCVGIRPLENDVCEMKRLYVRAAARGQKLGRRLTLAAIEKARALGFNRMVLDSLPSMHTAQELYRSLGFRSIRPYYTNPLPSVTYMELDLTSDIRPS